MEKIWKLFESESSINRSDCSVKMSKLPQGVQYQSGLVESKDLKLQTMPKLVRDGSKLLEELPELKVGDGCLVVVNKVTLSLEKEISNAKKKTGSIVVSLQEAKFRVV